MADNRKGPRLTQTMGAVDPDPTPASGGGAHRGLAAFDKGGAAGPSHAHKGSSRWGGGSPSGPPPKKVDPRAARDDDEDLRPARTPSREPVADDEMVAVSGSSWEDEVEAPPEPKGRGRKRAPEPVEEVAEGEEEAAPPRRSGAWKWVLGGVLLLGAGGAAAWGIAASKKSSGDAADAQGADARAVVAKADTKASEPEEEDTAVAAEPEADADKGAAAGAGPAGEGGAAGKTAEAGAADAGASDPGKLDAAAEEPAPTGPAAWAPEAEAKNPWVAIAAAPADRRLGLRDDEAGDNLASARTGFLPAAKLMAPTKAYRIQAHEVSWGELELAKTIPELALFDRPRWLPNNAAKLAALPATRVPWNLARAYCRGLGGDLPSEAEWEWAARGPSDMYFPWGRDAVDSNDCHIFASGAAPVVAVATSKLDKTPDPAVYDLLGNAQEWTRDAWRPADPAAAEDPRAATHKAVRGWPLGNAGGHIPAEGTTYRAAACADKACVEAEAKTLERIGFRCVQAAP